MRLTSEISLNKWERIFKLRCSSPIYHHRDRMLDAPFISLNENNVFYSFPFWTFSRNLSNGVFDKLQNIIRSLGDMEIEIDREASNNTMMVK